MPSYQTIHYMAPLETPIETVASFAPRPEAKWRVVCFPGTPSRKRIFARIMRRAPEDIEMVVVQRPGFAKWHQEPIIALDQQVKTIEPFLCEKRTIALGVSYGGMLSLKSALTYPDRIEGVVSVAALLREAYPYARRLADLGDFDWANKMVTRQARHVSAEIRGRRNQIEDLFAELSRLEKPVEIIHGNWDSLVPYKDASTLKDMIGDNANFTQVSRGTHWLEMQTPNQIYDAIRRVIARIEGPKS